MSTRTIVAGIIGAHFGIAAAITAGAVTLEPSSASTAPHTAVVATGHTRPPLPRYIRHEIRQEDGTNGWWNDGSGHPFYTVTVPLFAAGRHGNVHRVGDVDCHFYASRRIHHTIATLCQDTRAYR